MKAASKLQAATLSLLLLASYAVAGDSPDFLVEMKIIDSGTEIATPSMMIREGVEGSLSIPGENSFAVGLVVSGVSDDEAHIIAEIESGKDSMSPELVAEMGEWASASTGELEFHVRVESLTASQ